MVGRVGRGNRCLRSGVRLLAERQRHRAIGGNALRAAVLGANDGLVSNFSLVMGVAGADSSGAAIVIAGFAGLLAGALSMALGEWLSVQSARELLATGRSIWISGTRQLAFGLAAAAITFGIGRFVGVAIA